MIVVRVLLLILTALLDLPSILWTIGIILIIVGAILYILGAMGRAVGATQPLLVAISSKDCRTSYSPANVPANTRAPSSYG